MERDRAANEERERKKKMASLTVEEVKKRLVYHRRGAFFYDTGKEYSEITAGSAKTRLVRAGSGQDEARDIILELEDNPVPKVYGSLAGYPRGITDIAGTRVLVLKQAVLPAGSPGEWPTIKSILGNLIDDPQNPQQLQTFYALLKTARYRIKYALTHGGRPAGVASPYSVFIGGRNLGKTNLLFKLIILPILGGRFANGKKALTARNDQPFNADSTGSELLIIDDLKSENTDMRERIEYNVKEIFYSAAVRIEPKGLDASTAPLTQVGIQFVNEDEESLNACPTINRNTQDKINVFFAASYRPEQVPPNETEAEKDALDTAIGQELPAFADFLDKYEIPEEIRDSRNGAACYQHPRAAQLLQDISPEGELLELVEQLLKNIANKVEESKETTFAPKRWKAVELVQRIKECSFASSFRGLKADNKRTLGMMLTKLAEERPERVTKHIGRANQSFYSFTLPMDGGTE